MDYISIAISFFAFVISYFSYKRSKRKDQFTISFELNSRTERASYEHAQIIHKMRYGKHNSEEERNNLLREKKLKSIELLNNYEFLSFLINNKEIKNKNIKKFFKPHFEVEIKRMFEDYYYEFYQDKGFEEIKKLR